MEGIEGETMPRITAAHARKFFHQYFTYVIRKKWEKSEIFPLSGYI